MLKSLITAGETGISSHTISSLFLTNKGCAMHRLYSYRSQGSNYPIQTGRKYTATLCLNNVIITAVQTGD